MDTPKASQLFVLNVRLTNPVTKGVRIVRIRPPRMVTVQLLLMAFTKAFFGEGRRKASGRCHSAPFG